MNSSTVMTTTLENIKSFSKSSHKVWEQDQSCRLYFNNASKECAALGQSVQGVGGKFLCPKKNLSSQSRFVPHPGWGESAQQWRSCRKLKFIWTGNSLWIHKKACFAWVFAFADIEEHLCQLRWVSRNLIFCTHITSITAAFNWTLSWHFTFQPDNSLQVLTNMVYKKSHLLEKDSKQLIKIVPQHQLQKGILPRSPSRPLC